MGAQLDNRPEDVEAGPTKTVVEERKALQRLILRTMILAALFHFLHFGPVSMALLCVILVGLHYKVRGLVITHFVFLVLFLVIKVVVYVGFAVFVATHVQFMHSLFETPETPDVHEGKIYDDNASQDRELQPQIDPWTPPHGHFRSGYHSFNATASFAHSHIHHFIKTLQCISHDHKLVAFLLVVTVAALLDLFVHTIAAVHSFKCISAVKRHWELETHGHYTQLQPMHVDASAPLPAQMPPYQQHYYAVPVYHSMAAALPNAAMPLQAGETPEPPML
mmetsp:Transcript_2798/g.6807  ORF Transcript_2798/g.6807 Transcript_2798/m.6807 type:complete len:278 (+) Transcript_2798:71-904(+)|eukprot:CAMPEP_0177640448 /NCGR_PEP_ID=MMETSP0447-20121125/6547_1 /TAXON_ID=0 /ORGANISM="Stygamoeba regulata, Strain BSH-02190019" /LENGTH=277 /DNA_ID=CAMNT_0019142517 /DNA_START=71 /DNA_END=904 /DNA_ORIENTATION=-